MEDAYRWQAFYRSLGARETDVSCLREMFTTGYPIRDKLDAQLSKWIGMTEIVLASSADNPKEIHPAQAAVSVNTQESLAAFRELKPTGQDERVVQRARNPHARQPERRTPSYVRRNASRRSR